MNASKTTTYTHPDVLTVGVRDGWADPVTDPRRIDWPARQAAALIPFTVAAGRPVNPFAPTGIEHGRNELGHWGEAVAADALVVTLDPDGCRWIVMVEREDGHGWALPGGMVEPGESPGAAAVRELAEETTLDLSWADWHTTTPRYVPDPRASDEAWIVSVLSRCYLGTYHRDDRAELFAVAGADDAARAAWVHADRYDALTSYLASVYRGTVFAAHRALLADVLNTDPSEV
ncbi:hypothetical protein GCM10010399_37340 [Dactylosporangium fulvum]|uniref:NUDIX domain-containing protein n=1 Tax=Dactylosporangium fulvum TaxID=53359 RepID=A0ABY5VVW0_9ACTN|nr:NUDIX domain-containing protein [Dactylosporangium fulvum]UWP80956.1 NUDIX domain-containing protein [Dactylosporangium fulvum]